MALKYYTEFEQYNNRPDPLYRGASLIRIEIADNSYEGAPILLLQGAKPLTIDFANTGDNKLQPLRGSQATMQFIANADFQLADLYTDQEMKWIVSVIRDGAIIWKGYVIPDGCRERFVDPPYVVTVKAVDGLGILKNIPFAYADGEVIKGKRSVLWVLTHCLNKTGLDMNINTFTTLNPNTATGSDPFLTTQIWADRFIEDADKNEAMSCGEVIEGLLIEWGCIIIQHKGEWLIFRLIDLVALGGVAEFWRYTPAGTFVTKHVINTNITLGNNNGQVIHSQNDQERSIDNPYKRVVVRYEYGLLENLLSDEVSQFTGNLLGEFNGWNKIGAITATPAVFSGEPARVQAHFNADASRFLRIKETIAVTGGENLSISVNFNLGDGVKFGVSIWLITPGGFLFLTQDGFTSTEPRTLMAFNENKNQDMVLNYDFSIPDGGGSLGFDIYPPIWYDGFGSPIPSWDLKLNSISLTQKLEGKDIISESHIVTNNANYTTVPDVFEVHTGESLNPYYLGTMFKTTGAPTNGWRNGLTGEVKPFLQLAAEAILAMYGTPMDKYEGTVYGYFNYFSIFTIENLEGLFFPISVSYDMKRNEARTVLVEVSDVVVPHTYRLEYEYKDPKEANVTSGE